VAKIIDSRRRKTKEAFSPKKMPSGWKAF